MFSSRARAALGLMILLRSRRRRLRRRRLRRRRLRRRRRPRRGRRDRRRCRRRCRRRGRRRHREASCSCCSRIAYEKFFRVKKQKAFVDCLALNWLRFYTHYSGVHGQPGGKGEEAGGRGQYHGFPCFPNFVTPLRIFTDVN